MRLLFPALALLAACSQMLKTLVLDSISTLPAGFSGENSCAEIQCRWLYGSNRGHNSIAVLASDATTGKLSTVAHEPTRGEIPRSFLVMLAGKWLLAANQNSSSVAVFSIDAATGKLGPVGEPARVATPVCLKVW